MSMLPLPLENCDIIFLIWSGSVSQHLGLYSLICCLLRPKQPTGWTQESSDVLIQATVGKHHLDQAKASNLINSRSGQRATPRSKNNSRFEERLLQWDMRHNDLAQCKELDGTVYYVPLSPKIKGSSCWGAETFILWNTRKHFRQWVSAECQGGTESSHWRGREVIFINTVRR